VKVCTLGKIRKGMSWHLLGPHSSLIEGPSAEWNFINSATGGKLRFYFGHFQGRRASWRGFHPGCVHLYEEKHVRLTQAGGGGERGTHPKRRRREWSVGIGRKDQYRNKMPF